MTFTLANSGMGSVDWKKVATHFAIYFVGYGALAGVEYLLKLNFGSLTPVINLLGGALADTIRKNLDGVKE